MNKLDKKQIPQFAALCVLSAGAFGYFVVKIVTPSPAAAGTRPRPASEVVLASAASPTSASPAGTKSAAAPGDAAGGDEAPVPVPTPGMRDPFVVGYVDPATGPAPAPPAPNTAPAPVPGKAVGPVRTAPAQVASIREVAPASVATSALPFGLKGFPAPGGVPGLPVAPRKTVPAVPAAPAWTVTGVLQSAAGQIAVLRNGEARRIVRTGDGVDGLYRVVTVTRSAVVLRHGATLYRLTLGAAKATPSAPALPALSPAPAAPPPAPVAAPEEDARVPAGLSADLSAGLPRMVEGVLLMARSYLTPAGGRMDTCFAAPPAPFQETALAPLGPPPLDLGRTAWDFIVADTAGELPTRLI